MTYQTIGEFNVTSIDGILVYLANAVPYSIGLFLLTIYVIFSMLIYLGTRKFAGQGDVMAAFAVGGYVTFVIGIMMTLTSGIINVFTLIVAIGVAIISFILLMMRRNRD